MCFPIEKTVRLLAAALSVPFNISFGFAAVFVVAMSCVCVKVCGGGGGGSWRVDLI